MQKNNRLIVIFLTLLSIVLFLSFIFFSYLVAKKHFNQLDFDTTVKLQNHISRRWDVPFSILSLIGSAEVTVVIWFIFWGFLIFKKMWFTVLAFFLMPLGLLMELFGKNFVKHPGPPFMFYRGLYNFNFISSFVSTQYSYPSGHLTRTAFLVVFLMTFIFFKVSWKKQIFIQPFLLFFIFIMGLSRVYLAEHWLSDVIGGTLVGCSFGILAGLTTLRSKIPGKFS